MTWPLSHQIRHFEDTIASFESNEQREDPDTVSRRLDLGLTKSFRFQPGGSIIAQRTNSSIRPPVPAGN